MTAVKAELPRESESGVEKRKLAVAFVRALRQLIETAGLSQDELAEAAGLDRTCPSLLKRRLKSPLISTILQCADASRRLPAELIEFTARNPLCWKQSQAATGQPRPTIRCVLMSPEILADHLPAEGLPRVLEGWMGGLLKGGSQAELIQAIRYEPAAAQAMERYRPALRRHPCNQHSASRPKVG
jgi:predicted XRE-type DNA-binding protein